MESDHEAVTHLLAELNVPQASLFDVFLINRAVPRVTKLVQFSSRAFSNKCWFRDCSSAYCWWEIVNDFMKYPPSWSKLHLPKHQLLRTVGRWIVLRFPHMKLRVVSVRGTSSVQDAFLGHEQTCDGSMLEHGFWRWAIFAPSQTESPQASPELGAQSMSWIDIQTWLHLLAYFYNLLHGSYSRW
jgi:hypothetical protein